MESDEIQHGIAARSGKGSPGGSRQNLRCRLFHLIECFSARMDGAGALPCTSESVFRACPDQTERPLIALNNRLVERQIAKP